MEAYTDADWTSAKSDERLTTTYNNLVGDNPVVWRSEKQQKVAISSSKVIKIGHMNSCG